MARRKTTTHLIIHCAATPPSMDVGAAKIRDWHVNGNGWSDIGYQWVIRRDGTVEKGRAIDQVGAHAGYNWNYRSVGVCMAGGVTQATRRVNGRLVRDPEDNFTQAQFDALAKLIVEMDEKYGDLEVIGHRDTYALDGLPQLKACPSFDVAAWLASRDFSEEASITEEAPADDGKMAVNTAEIVFEMGSGSSVTMTVHPTEVNATLSAAMSGGVRKDNGDDYVLYPPHRIQRVTVDMPAVTSQGE